MKSPNRCTPSAGFTLIEMLVVIGLLVLITGFVMVSDFSSYRGARFRAERSTLITLLQTARADALNNIRQSNHGIALFPADHPKSYVLFDGDSYESSDNALHEVVDADYEITFSSSSPKEIIFCQLSGDAVRAVGEDACDERGRPDRFMDGDIVLLDDSRGFSFSISINHEGAISW